MPLKPEEIARLRKQMQSLKSDQSRIDEIAKLNHKVSIPVLIQIVSDGYLQYKAASDNAEKATLFFLDLALTLLKSADEKQNWDWFDKVKAVVSLDKAGIIKDHDNMLKACEQIQVTAATRLNWHEAVCWLKGSYFHIYQQLPKNQSGELIRDKNGMACLDESDDRDFLKHFGLTKHFLTEYNFKVSQIIETKLQEIAVKKEKEWSFDDLAVLTEEHDDTVQIKFNLPKSALDKLPLIEQNTLAVINEHTVDQAVYKSLAASEFQKKETLADVLSQLKDEENDVRFVALFYALEEFSLSDRQQRLMNGFLQTVKAELESYVNASMTTKGVPTMLWGRQHKVAVNTVIRGIQEGAGVTHNLFCLHDLWKETVAKNSIDLHSRLVTLLDQMYLLLVKNLASEPVAITSSASHTV